MFAGVLPHLQCGKRDFGFPDVSRLASIFSGSTAKKTTFQTASLQSSIQIETLTKNLKAPG